MCFIGQDIQKLLVEIYVINMRYTYTRSQSSFSVYIISNGETKQGMLHRLCDCNNRNLTVMQIKMSEYTIKKSWGLNTECSSGLTKWRWDGCLCIICWIHVVIKQRKAYSQRFKDIFAQETRLSHCIAVFSVVSNHR